MVALPLTPVPRPSLRNQLARVEVEPVHDVEQQHAALDAPPPRAQVVRSAGRRSALVRPIVRPQEPPDEEHRRHPPQNRITAMFALDEIALAPILHRPQVARRRARLPVLGGSAFPPRSIAVAVVVLAVLAKRGQKTHERFLIGDLLEHLHPLIHVLSLLKTPDRSTGRSSAGYTRTPPLPSAISWREWKWNSFMTSSSSIRRSTRSSPARA